MLRLIARLTLVAVIAGCGGKKGEEQIACKMTKKEAEAIETKINTDAKEHKKKSDEHFGTDPTDFSKKQEGNASTFKQLFAGTMAYGVMQFMIIDFVAAFDSESVQKTIVYVFRGISSIILLDMSSSRPFETSEEKTKASEEIKRILIEHKLFELADCLMKNLRQATSSLNKNKYKNTLAAYSILEKLYSEFRDGKFDTLSKIEINKAKEEFDRLIDQAELESK